MKLVYHNYGSEEKFKINSKNEIEDKILNDFKINKENEKLMNQYLENTAKIRELNKINKEILSKLRDNFDVFKHKNYPEYFI